MNATTARKKRDLLSLTDINSEEIQTLFHRTSQLKAAMKPENQ